ncbi:MAG: hypothetical protein EBR82_36910 [Caulobacteraceae bacterium]|nr:hypothetical protein [Caulobacteraceae bacterium]
MDNSYDALGMDFGDPEFDPADYYRMKANRKRAALLMVDGCDERITALMLNKRMDRAEREAQIAWLTRIRAKHAVTP